MNTTKATDIACTFVGSALLAALAWSIATGEAGWSEWKVHAVWGGVGLVLMLPFGQLMRLVDALPWTDDEGGSS